MFTGLVEEVGTIASIQKGAKSCILTINCKKVLDHTKIGDSIMVNGVCLTVTTMGTGVYTADVMSETINRTNLGELSIGSSVNLERAMPADGRFGGHIVAGHIDDTGVVMSIKPDDNAIWYQIGAPADVLRYIVEKGSITIDGISLTVAYVDDQCFKVSIIPHTQKVTALGTKKVGSKVNLETDIIGKYVEKLLMKPASNNNKESKLTAAFLAENGF